MKKNNLRKNLYEVSSKVFTTQTFSKNLKRAFLIPVESYSKQARIIHEKTTGENVEYIRCWGFYYLFGKVYANPKLDGLYNKGILISFNLPMSAEYESYKR